MLTTFSGTVGGKLRQVLLCIYIYIYIYIYGTEVSKPHSLCCCVGIHNMGRTALAVESVYLYVIIYKRLNQEYINPLTPELYPSAQRCLTRFFLLGILLLEPCISLIYA
jgi:hypothetical protein